MKLRVGTSGWAYKEWKGSFYPEKIAPDGMLAHYAGRLPAVEVNNTFYRLPRESVLATWAEQVPPEFRFSIKASRRITHVRRLKGADDETLYLLRAVHVLGPKLGVLLFQLPPNLKADAGRLEAFLDLLPGGIAAAFEFRHRSWFADETLDLLRDRGRALCVADTEEADPPPVLGTAGFGYLRLRRASYSDGELAEWAKRVKEQDWSEAYVFFKHEDEGGGPTLAARFLELAGGGSGKRGGGRDS